MADQKTNEQAVIRQALDAARRALQEWCIADDERTKLGGFRARRKGDEAGRVFVAAFLGALPAAVFRDYGEVPGIPHTHALAAALEVGT